MDEQTPHDAPHDGKNVVKFNSFYCPVNAVFTVGGLCQVDWLVCV